MDIINKFKTDFKENSFYGHLYKNYESFIIQIEKNDFQEDVLLKLINNTQFLNKSAENDLDSKLRDADFSRETIVKTLVCVKFIELFMDMNGFQEIHKELSKIRSSKLSKEKGGKREEDNDDDSDSDSDGYDDDAEEKMVMMIKGYESIGPALVILEKILQKDSFTLQEIKDSEEEKEFDKYMENITSIFTMMTESEEMIANSLTKLNDSMETDMIEMNNCLELYRIVNEFHTLYTKFREIPGTDNSLALMKYIVKELPTVKAFGYNLTDYVPLTNEDIKMNQEESITLLKKTDKTEDDRKRQKELVYISQKQSVYDLVNRMISVANSIDK
jgi:hypothetical protein